jgi:hypothetical protein
MDLETEAKTPQQTIEELRSQARIAGKAATATVVINGRECRVTATSTRYWLFFKKTNIEIESRALDGQICKVSFIYNGKRGVEQGFQSLREKIAQADQESIDATTVPQVSNECPREQVLATIFSKIADYTQLMPINDMNSHAPGICKFLSNTANFVRQNDLAKDEISDLKLMLRILCNVPIIECENGDFTINEYDRDPHCRTIALQAESLEILLDAKACGQVGLERNVPPPVKALGSGNFNTVQLAHRKPGIDGGEALEPIVLKPCDHSKSAEVLAKVVDQMENSIGPATGSYRRNLATAGVQDMLCEIGAKKSIAVPHVIATVSAAEMDGTPCIAMEMLEGQTLRKTVNAKSIELTNEFMCRETWTQIHDILTGQIDRYGGNVILTKDGPVAIDHDLSFPTNPPRGIAGTVPLSLVAQFGVAVDGISPRNYGMPPVIDREMHDVIMAIDLPALKNMYEECGLTKPEVDAAMARARGLKDAAQQLESVGRVIEPNTWASQFLLVSEHCNRQNFYAFRHFYGE